MCLRVVARSDVRAAWWKDDERELTWAGRAIARAVAGCAGGATGWAGAAARLAAAGGGVPASLAFWEATAGPSAGRATAALSDRTPPAPLRNATRALPARWSPRPPISPGRVVAARSASAEIPPALGTDIAGRRAAAERRSRE
jgi:hypothetical protein